MNKKKLRKKYFCYRQSLSQKEVFDKSYEIFFQMKKIFFIWGRKYYHIFLPIRKYKEVDTFILVNFLLKRGKYITIPCSNFNRISIENCFFDKNVLLKKNNYGILEPVPRHKYVVSPYFIEIIFIPLLIFDLRGYRIGYGKGFYDRFIPLCKKNVIKIGLSFFSPIKKIIDIHENDLSIDIGITPDHIFFFENIKKKIL
ncbi:5-formyltetrahydrofolate cyclo-ligase [Blattabacterium sp. (Blattella germanica) str. Bge]|uniref:5-formyltetrahydrofolate cyclo-ligase n=1 Tax=Blattabacterium sp. (Blattella germanica) TaxID=624186 RepID=UPI0001BB60D7|nr:5-formyltetrahydrofolate cyclo-ligase [Blattabacterium sp. (Blattella germanica)]ACY40161.1 5-formyltetrahydrofolate cyclo-ligase [Blattabacterium sp. (Blattella germanica) str. Bge]